jgi:hypothetical protein
LHAANFLSQILKVLMERFQLQSHTPLDLVDTLGYLVFNDRRGIQGNICLCGKQFGFK